jgi:hypothetical protein
MQGLGRSFDLPSLNDVIKAWIIDLFFIIIIIIIISCLVVLIMDLLNVISERFEFFLIIKVVLPFWLNA